MNDRPRFRDRFRNIFRKKDRARERHPSAPKTVKPKSSLRRPGGRGKSVTGRAPARRKGVAPSLTWDDRHEIYTRQNNGGPLTPKQRRRLLHKQRRVM